MKVVVPYSPAEEYDFVNGLCILFEEVDINGPGTCREVCPGAVILYFQQLSFVWADGDYTNCSPYRIEAIVNPAQWIFVLEKQRRGIVELLDISEPSIDVTKIKFGQAYITWSGHSLDESGTRVVWTCT